jgi:hypothetical protein
MGGSTLRQARRTLALSFALLALPASEATAALEFPDLVADPPGAASAPQVYDDGGRSRLLVRFDGFVHNQGPGALEIRASNPVGPAMTTVQQRIYDSAGGFQDKVASPAPGVIYETNDDHDHWHLKHIARYSLWNQAGTAEVGPAQKVGFCLVDSQRMEGSRPSAYTVRGHNFCEQRTPGASSVTMGVSGGWRDIYDKSLAFQWVDVSDVVPGSYKLRSEIDPERRIIEANEQNPPSFAPGLALVPGYVARDVSQPRAQGSRQVQLGATKVGSVPGAPQFKIVTAPQHGSLDQPVGQWFGGDSVRYTPQTGYSGPDSFTFAARDPASSFPRNPPAAVASLENDGSMLVTISGAPETVQTGASAQLSAVVQNGPPDVTWSVDGVDGGSASSGTISASGLYRAPAQVPPAGQVQVSARTASGDSGEVVIKIVKAPVAQPAPDVPGAVLGVQDQSDPDAKKKPLLSPLRFARHGKRLLVSLRSTKAGVVVVRARKHGRRIGHCRSRVTANQRMTCSIGLNRLRPRVAAFICRVPRTSGLRLARIRVSATLYVKGEKRAVRRGRVRAKPPALPAPPRARARGLAPAPLPRSLGTAAGDAAGAT